MVFDINKKIPLNMGKFDLRRQNHVIKGEIGEIILKNKIPYLYRTKEIKPRDILDYKFPFGKIPLAVREFLTENWYTLDLFRFLSENYKFKNVELYEIKVRNYYPNLRREAYIPDITCNELKAYKTALKLGFIVKSAIIWFYDDWRYDLVIKYFNPKDFKIHDGSKKFINFLKGPLK